MLPPYAALLRLRMEEEAGETRWVMPFHPDVVGRPGFLHGGAIAGLLEFAAFGSLASALGDAAITTKPISVTVDYLRGGSDHDTFAVGTILRLGSRIANVSAVAWQSERDSPIASARINFLLERGGSG
jgi:uncharacterized protein (TIGR00369 family)